VVHKEGVTLFSTVTFVFLDKFLTLLVEN